MTITIAKGALTPLGARPPKRFGHTRKPIDGSRRCGARGTESRGQLDGLAASSVGDNADADAANVATSKKQRSGPVPAFFLSVGAKSMPQGSQCVLREVHLVQQSLDMHVYDNSVDQYQFVYKVLHVAVDVISNRNIVPYPLHFVVGLSQPLAENNIPDHEVGTANVLLMRKKMQLRSTANGRTSIEASRHLVDVCGAQPASVATSALQRKKRWS